MTCVSWKWSRNLIALCTITLCIACEQSPQYSELEDGTQWALMAFDKDELPDNEAAWLRLQASVLHHRTNDTLRYYAYSPFLETEDVLWDLLKDRPVGDSLHVIFFNANMLAPRLSDGDTLLAKIKILARRSSEELNDARSREFEQLERIINAPDFQSAFEERDGLWIRWLERGDTAKVRKGREVLIHYQGRFFDDRVFDDSRKGFGPLRFVYGTEDQVIKGVEMALSHMHLGDVAELLIPSWHAYGKRGSVDGRVAPFTPVIYRVEVIELGV